MAGEEKKKLSMEEAEEMVKLAKAEKLQACGQEIQQVLDKYNCRIETFATIIGDKVNTGLNLKFKE